MESEDQSTFIGDDSKLVRWSWGTLIVIACLCYAALCSSLRFRRVNQIRRRYEFYDRSSLSRMTHKEAQEIAKVLSCSESPTLYDFSLRLALFRTYAAENIGKLLYCSSDLSNSKQALKRYEDTGLLYSTLFIFPLDSDLFLKSVARINYLHHPYIKSGRISNRDLLYVLWASMAGPIRFFELYEWRPLTDMEIAAQGTLWLYIGGLMGIDFESELGKQTWADGIDFMQDVTRWAMTYEDEHMRPHAEIKALGEILMDLLLGAYPMFMRPFLYKSALVMIGDRMRYLFGFPEPSMVDIVFAYNVLLARKLFMRYLVLPRISLKEFLSHPDAQTGRINRYHYFKEPWYVQSTFWGRWGPMAVLIRCMGGKLPGDDAPHFKSQGFLFEDIGPRGTVGQGAEQTEQIQGALYLKSAGSRCPFLATEKLEEQDSGSQ